MKNRSENDLHSYEATEAVAKKVQKRFWGFNGLLKPQNVFLGFFFSIPLPLGCHSQHDHAVRCFNMRSCAADVRYLILFHLFTGFYLFGVQELPGWDQRACCTGFASCFVLQGDPLLHPAGTWNYDICKDTDTIELWIKVTISVTFLLASLGTVPWRAVSTTPLFLFTSGDAIMKLLEIRIKRT